jgi:membrane fusion protein (multidrug efflux system)
MDQAQGTLAQMEALHENARANLARVKPLAAQNALSKKDLDDAVASEGSARAQVISAKASVEKARLDLGFTRITSLINGMAGIARAQVGDLVGPAVQGGELTTVSTINPIKIYYTINEQAYIAFMKRFSSESAGLEEAKKLRIELILGDGSPYPHAGRFYAIDRQVDVRTGTLRVAALFPNPTNILRPGQFVRVRVLIGTKQGALLIPQRSVMELQGSYQVAVVGPDNKVDIRTVKPGERVGSFWVIDEGLKPGERVVAEGLQKVKEGISVKPKPFAGVSTVKGLAAGGMR